MEELPAMPGLGEAYRRAVLPPVPVLRRPPPLPELLVRGTTVDGGAVARYHDVCGWAGAVIAPTYPHVLAFPLALNLMSRPGFPLPLMGLVHAANHIEQARPLVPGERVDIRVRADSTQSLRRARRVDLVTAVAAGGVEVWRERATYLHKRRSGPMPPPAEPAPVAAPLDTWRIGAEVGPAYARVSGDRNPIHTSTLAARLFGFPRPIAHGMWSLAQCLARLDDPAPSTVDVVFQAPILLPARVSLTVDGPRFTLADADTGRPHVVGSVRAAP